MATWAIYDRGPSGTWRWLVTFDMFQTQEQAEVAMQALLQMPQHCHLRERAVVLPTLEGSTGYEQIEFLGKCMTVTAWARLLHINQVTLHNRLHSGMTLEQAVTTPLLGQRTIHPETDAALGQLQAEYEQEKRAGSIRRRRASHNRSNAAVRADPERAANLKIKRRAYDERYRAKQKTKREAARFI